jgi:hypothetical protein
MVLGLLVSGCTKKYCYIGPSLNQIIKVNPGDIMIQKVECFGRVTVNECRTSLELIYLGNTGTYIRIGERSGVRGHIVGSASSGIFETYNFQASIVLPSLTEFTYPMDSRLIDFQGTKFEVTDIGDAWIRFRLISISTIGCDKVNGQEVK